jgi:hypothetical protein
MKSLNLIILFVVLTAFNSSFVEVKKSVEIVVKSNSEVSISGTSNINSFKCCYNITKLENPISVSFESRDKNMVFQTTFLELENDCFDCGHKAINKDFNKLIKTELYPKIELKLIAIEQTSKLKNTYNARVEIYIANCSNTYTFPIQVTEDEDFNIKGNLSLDLRDYNLEAPKKMMGLIVVDPDVVVNFNLHIKQV